MKHPREADVKLELGDWLTQLGFPVFDEKRNPKRPQWPTFQVRNTQQGKRPDLVVCGDLRGGSHLRGSVYVAVEVKVGVKHQDILDAFDAVLQYFCDYLWGAEYMVGETSIEIGAFVVATRFSRRGFLWEAEGKFQPERIVKGPFDAHPNTFSVSRLLWRQRDNLLKRLQQLSAVPGIERRLREGPQPHRSGPQVGVLVQEPTGKGHVILMVPPAPYHWRFEPPARRI
jgi:hypothetical protein